MCPLQNKLSEQIEKNYSGICRRPLRAFQQTCVARGTAEAMFTPTGKQQLHLWFESKGTTPQNGPYSQLLFLQQLFTLKPLALLGDASCTDPEENGTGKDCGKSVSCIPCPKASWNTAIAPDRCLLLTNLHLWNSYYWLPTHLLSDSLSFFFFNIWP